MTEETLKVQQLCLSCGMCCDGTLFNHAKCKSGSAETLDFIKHGFSFFTKDDDKKHDYFHLPCSLHDEQKGCTIYSQDRPNVCGNFFCQLIKDFQNDVITFQTASNKILELKNVIRTLNIKIDSLNKIETTFPLKSKVDMFYKTLPSNRKLSSTLEKEILLELGKYHFLIKSFYLKKKETQG